MPKKPHTDVQYYNKPGFLLEPKYSEFGALIGAIVVEAATAESYLGVHYAYMVVGNSNNTMLVMETFDHISAFKQRLSMVKTVAKRCLDNATATEFNRLLGNLQNALDPRHKIAHGRWMLNDAFPDKIFKFRATAGFEDIQPYSIRDLRDVLDRIITTSHELNVYWHSQMMPKVKIFPQVTVNLGAFKNSDEGSQSTPRSE